MARRRACAARPPPSSRTRPAATTTSAARKPSPASRPVTPISPRSCGPRARNGPDFRRRGQSFAVGLLVPVVPSRRGEDHVHMLLPTLVVLSTMHYEGDVPAAGGDYLDVPIEVPVGTVEIQIPHADGSDFDILDWGVWQPDGQFRGWGGGNEEDAIIGVDQSSRSYLPGPIAAGTWVVNVGKAKLDANGGHYSIDVVCRSDATLPVQPKAAFDPVVLSPERRWYKGDFHVHSEQSGDATATFD